MKKRYLLSALFFAVTSSVVHADDNAIKNSLKKVGIEDAEIHPAPVAGVKTVLTGNGVLYVTDDGKYLMEGPLYDLSGAIPVNQTHELLATKAEALSKQMIVYKAPKEKYAVTVFTDITCGYCHKLHEEMADYNALGITIRYLAFPRQGLETSTATEMKSIWCAADRNKAFDAAMKGDKVAPASCDIDLSKHYQLGIQYGIQGTPAIVTPAGSVIPGYQSAAQLKQILDSQTKGN
ncbi:MAG: Thiol:disulfide interchange protein DsbC [Candidatus Erwinia impunctatus]|nr:Thiol:disulfide interchange protein DsbC [Culicoides impunctatus]